MLRNSSEQLTGYSLLHGGSRDGLVIGRYYTSRKNSELIETDLWIRLRRVCVCGGRGAVGVYVCVCVGVWVCMWVCECVYVCVCQSQREKKKKRKRVDGN